jgi:hypothetical protein
MYVKDFDKNGFNEQILTAYMGDTSYPIALRDDLIKTLPYLRTRFLSYKDYASQTVTDIFSPDELKDAIVKHAYTIATALVRNDGNGAFTLVPLPVDAQMTSTHGVLAADYDRDGALDVLLAGNFDGVKPEIGRIHAGFGVFLRGDGKGGFAASGPRESGFFVPGQARDIQRVRTRRGDLYVVTRNNDKALVFRASPQSAAGAQEVSERR